MTDSKTYTTSEICAAAGCKVGTFQKWRKRNALFPGSVGAEGWNRWTLLDACIVRAIVVFTDHGLSADDAVSLAVGVPIDRLSYDLGQIVAGEEPTTKFVAAVQGNTLEPDELVGDANTAKLVKAKKLPPAKIDGRLIADSDFSPSRLTLIVLGKGESSIANLMSRKIGAATIVSLHAIVDHVVDALNARGEK